MEPQKIKQLHDLCLVVGKIKQQLTEDLPHYGHHALYLQNDEITTGQLNNKTEIKIHLIANKLVYFHNEEGHTIDLSQENLTEKLQELAQKYNLELPDLHLEKVGQDQLTLFLDYAQAAKRVLELFRMKLEGNYTLIHLWPDHFDFSIEWFTGNKDEQIGTGISPGDEKYSLPYLYMNPWPFNDKVARIDLPIGKWHMLDWNGIKVEWEDLKKYSPKIAADKIHELFVVAKKNFEV